MWSIRPHRQPLGTRLPSPLLLLGRVAEWQTRWLQVPVRATSWGFKSPLAHCDICGGATPRHPPAVTSAEATSRHPATPTRRYGVWNADGWCTRRSEQEYLHHMGGLAETDEHGMAAYACAADRTLLASVPGSPAVLQCPTCAHRTDEVGEGVLGDGFDVVHRQWGLRGDPHAWRAMREFVGTTPTPPDPEVVRAAYVDALRGVADVDIDHTDEQSVYRQHLDHGGMSGGGVNVGWWRTKGIPLLVDRATDRRPPTVDATSAAAPRTTGRGPCRSCS
jgi:hypothetical protein